jgi:hypothetical protein
MLTISMGATMTVAMMATRNDIASIPGKGLERHPLRAEQFLDDEVARVWRMHLDDVRIALALPRHRALIVEGDREGAVGHFHDQRNPARAHAALAIPASRGRTSFAAGLPLGHGA